MTIRSCVTPNQHFMYGIHKPTYTVPNLRQRDSIQTLGRIENETFHTNKINFPESDIQVNNADWIFEIPNPFAFRGSTFINKEWADNRACNPGRIYLPPPPSLSFSKILEKEQIEPDFLEKLPAPLLLTLATTSTDPSDLIQLAKICCHILKDSRGVPQGIQYRKTHQGQIRAVITDHDLFEAVANNPALPDDYKRVMVLRPGAQGGSEIIGDVETPGETHIFEYLRRNSYIAGGHYAANMADDAVRYSIGQLTESDMSGLRHLYYQRSFIRLASQLEIKIDPEQKIYSANSLEQLRCEILQKIKSGSLPSFTATLWGWNFGFDYTPTRYRLHASHQQIHQQYSMLPENIDKFSGNTTDPTGRMASFGCGDMIAEVIQDYQTEHSSSFFADYLACIRNNKRMDNREDLETSLIVWEDKHTMLFVPKAQTSQWELQLMALTNQNCDIIGNILEADPPSRASLNIGIFHAQKILAGLGAKMVTTIEYPKRIGKSVENSQHLLYSFLPRLPESPGAFSEAQLRFINGHYPEDFAAVCRQQLKQMTRSVLK